ncbi:MAG: hypothetical protein KKE73_06750 [Proteobacteria bacterium]|nr:hypothetical protein [Pseudomonadota bacterium]
MQYVVPVLLVLLGLLSINLIRVGVRTGIIQSRLLKITREQSAFSFWSAIAFQVLVSALCFAGAYWHLKLSGVV